MLKSIPVFVLLLLFVHIASAQYKFQPVLTGLSGQALIDKLVENYKPLTVMDYSSARDTLYSKVYKENDSLACFYSNYKLALPEGVDPTTFVYMNGSKDGINAEHAYPQSKGAEGGAKSDMNILYPAKANVNEARSNLPYGESPDNKTQKWFYKKAELTTIPSINKDLYSELNSSLFEPREAVKGNVARAVFYFFTMYHEEAIGADPDFFNSQVNTLCQWHLLDPVDSLEWVRAGIIAKYQSNRVNPFVLDCTLPYRTYCPNYLPNCDTTFTSAYEPKTSKLMVFPNPSHDGVTFCLPDNNATIRSVSVINLNGTLLMSKEMNTFSDCVQLTPVDLEKLQKGMYLARLLIKSGDSSQYYFAKFSRL